MSYDFDEYEYKKLHPTVTRIGLRRARYDELHKHGMSIQEMWDKAGKKRDLWDEEWQRWKAVKR